MDSIEMKLDLLIDGMKKKEQALREAASITENQSTVLESGLSKDEILAFIVTMNKEKQNHIQTVIDCDHFFEGILKEIGPAVDASPHLYKPQITTLQQQIRCVMDLDVSIRVQEERNNDRMNKLGQKPAAPPTTAQNTAPPARGKPPAVIQDENRVIRAYENNSKNYKG